jgi:tetratricopeptide (TPR) repeat protein
MRGLLMTVLAASLMTACGSPPAATVPAPDARTQIEQARRLDLDGKHDEAVAIYREVLSREPQSFDAQYGIGRALDLAGAYEDARQHFAMAVDLAPEGQKDQALRMLGVSWTFVGNAGKAAEVYGRVFDRQVASGSFAGAADVASELGRVYLELGHLDEAETWYRSAHETAAREAGRPAWQIDLADMRWAHAQARIAARRGRAEEARRQEAVYARLLAKGGNSDQTIQQPYLLGYVDFYLGHDAEAVAHLEQADQTDPFILLLLAEAQEKLGDAARARQYYRKVLDSSSHAVNNAFARPVALGKIDVGGTTPTR